MTTAAERLVSAHGSHLGLSFAKGAVLKRALDVEFIHSLIMFSNANKYSSGFLNHSISFSSPSSQANSGSRRSWTILAFSRYVRPPVKAMQRKRCPADTIGINAKPLAYSHTQVANH